MHIPLITSYIASCNVIAVDGEIPIILTVLVKNMTKNLRKCNHCLPNYVIMRYDARIHTVSTCLYIT